MKLREYLFEMSLLAIMVRSFIAGASISDALVLVTLVGAILYTKEYLYKTKMDDKAELKEEMIVLKNEIASLKLDRGFKQSGILNNKVQFFTNDEHNEPIRRF